MKRYMNKKLGIVLKSIAAAVSIVLLFSVNVFAGTVTATGDKETAAVGDTYTVNIVIDGAEGAAVAPDVSVHYDVNRLEFVSCTGEYGGGGGGLVTINSSNADLTFNILSGGQADVDVFATFDGDSEPQIVTATVMVDGEDTAKINENAREDTGTGIEAGTVATADGKYVSSVFADEFMPVGFSKTTVTYEEQMNSFLSGVRTTVENTIRMGLLSMAHMLVQCAIAVSDKATHTAVHLKTEAIANGVTGVTKADTVSKLFNNPDFLVFTAHRIAETMDNAKVYSEAFNDGSRPTFTDTDYARLMVNNGFIRALQFNVESKFFNPEKLSFGKYDKITSWQGIKDSTSKFTPELTTKVAIAGDTNNKLGIGTEAYTSNCIALFFDKYALGICPYKRKVTSQYTASADFWTEFHHTLVNMIIDSSFNLVAFLAD